MKIAHIFADSIGEANSSLWRGRIIVDALRRVGHTISFTHIDTWMKDSRRSDLADADIIIIERVLVEESIQRAQFWRERGKAVVVDIDDAYHLLQSFEESGNQASKFWRDGIVDITYADGSKVEKRLGIKPLEQFRQGLKFCAGLTMPSRVLAEDWKTYAKCWFVPNYIDQERYLPFTRPLPHRTDEIIIGWGGSMSHKISFEKSGVATALRNVLRQRPQAKLMVCGDQRIIDIVKCPPQQAIHQPYVTWNEWPRVLSRFDIGLAPLHGKYDWSRSAIKGVEYSTMGIPFIATGCPTYIDFQDAGVGEYIQDGEDNSGAIGDRAVLWETKLLDMIDHYPAYLAKARSQHDREHAQEWWVDRRVNDIAATYQEIVESVK